MAQLLARLLLLIAVLTAPLSMSAASSAPTQHGSAAMAMEHCHGRQQPAPAEKGIADCAMACAAALPAIVPPVPAAAAPVVQAPEPPVISARLADRNLEIATPPPKRS